MNLLALAVILFLFLCPPHDEPLWVEAVRKIGYRRDA